MIDLNSTPLEVKISADGKTLWINDEKECILRAQNIPRLMLSDSRKKP